jgi:hypothetical protein
LFATLAPVMRGLFFSSWLLLLSFVLGSSATAQTRPLGGSGVWSAYGGLTEGGRQVCGMHVFGSEQRDLHIKWFSGNNHLTIQAFKPSWNIPQGTRMPLVIGIDGRVGWNVPEAFGVGALVEWIVSRQTFDEFVAAFRLGNTLTVSFPGGSEPPWVASLRGSLATFELFAACILSAGGFSTQPHARSGPRRDAPAGVGPPKDPPASQPFGR